MFFDLRKFALTATVSALVFATSAVTISAQQNSTALSDRLIEYNNPELLAFYTAQEFEPIWAGNPARLLA